MDTRKVTRCIAVKHEDPEWLARMVDKHIQAGWQLHGVVIETTKHRGYAGSDFKEFSQMMVAYEPTKTRKAK